MPDADCDDDEEADRLPVGVGVAAADGVAEGDADRVLERVALEDTLPLVEPDGDAETLGVPLAVVEKLDDSVSTEEPEADKEPEVEPELDAV